jgi:thiol:disulfide interchange protein DsbD
MKALARQSKWMILPALLFGSARASAMSVDVPRGGSSLVHFAWLAFGMGLLSLLTPCVFPMIPITVSYFSKHLARSRAEAARNAGIYALGIVSTFTGLGLMLAIAFGAAGVNKLSANPWVNLVIAAIFIAFALSLFGVYFIQLPSTWIARLDRRASSSGRVIGILGMGLVFSLTSFTCTAPFIGTMLVLASQGNWHWPLAGMLAFSVAFSIPFFLLALMPQAISRLPRAGSWLNIVKVLMGFLEIAASMKFLSNADLIWRLNIFTHQVVLSIWVAIGLLMVMYMIGGLRLENEQAAPGLSIGRLLVALVLLSTTVWLSSGLGGHSLGEIESFLPPANNSDTGSSTPSAPAALSWILNDYPAGLKQAELEGKPIFIDFTGYTCTNCRWMEANMFPRPEIRAELNKFVRVRLFTDREGQPYQGQQQMEKDRFDTVALPLYAILTQSGQIKASFPGLTRDPKEFLHFLSTNE